MTNRQFTFRLGVLFAVLFAVFWFWQTPGFFTGKLTNDEIEHYLILADKQLPIPDDIKKPITERLRVWAQADDGKPVYMLNLMRLHDQLYRFPGAPNYQGTPKDSNLLYENAATPLLAKNGGSFIYGSDIHDKNLITIGTDSALDNWSRMLVVRYPNRRAFLQLISDPEYAKIAAYKFMALDLLLVPTPGDVVLPDLRALFGAVLIILLLSISRARSCRVNKRQS